MYEPNAHIQHCSIVRVRDLPVFIIQISGSSVFLSVWSVSVSSLQNVNKPTMDENGVRRRVGNGQIPQGNEVQVGRT